MIPLRWKWRHAELAGTLAPISNLTGVHVRARRTFAAGALLLGCAAAGFHAQASASEPIAHSIAIRNGLVSRAQRVVAVPHDSLLSVEWTADRPMTVHLEGYDLSVTVRPDKPATMRFKTFATGRFPVHAHEGERRGASSGHVHGRGVLMWLEVHPK